MIAMGNQHPQARILAQGTLEVLGCPGKTLRCVATGAPVPGLGNLGIEGVIGYIRGKVQDFSHIVVEGSGTRRRETFEVGVWTTVHGALRIGVYSGEGAVIKAHQAL